MNVDIEFTDIEGGMILYVDTHTFLETEMILFDNIYFEEDGEGFGLE